MTLIRKAQLSPARLWSLRGPSDPIGAALQVALGISIVLCFYSYALGNTDWELLTTKHYWGRQWLYAGFASQVVVTRGGYRTVQIEGFYGTVSNLVPLSDPGPRSSTSPALSGFPSTERLLVPFLVYIVLRLSFGAIEVLTAFWIINVALWLLAIALVYRIAAAFFTDRYSPLIAALMTATYPVFTLTFHGVKVQPIGTVYLLAGIYLYEQHVRRRGALLQIVYLTALLFVGMLSSGGWAMFFVYVVLRLLWVRGHERLAALAAVFVAFVAARLLMSHMAMAYKLPLAEEYLRFSYQTMLLESGAWLRAWWRGENISHLKLLNYRGALLFQSFLPTISTAFVRGHLSVLVLAASACVVTPRARMFGLIAIPLFFVAHAGTMMSGWEWHYGYLSAPSATMLFLAVSGFLGELLAQPRWALRAISLCALGVVLFGFMDMKTHAGLYYGGNPNTYDYPVSVYMEGRPHAVTY